MPQKDTMILLIILIVYAGAWIRNHNIIGTRYWYIPAREKAVRTLHTRYTYDTAAVREPGLHCAQVRTIYQHDCEMSLTLRKRHRSNSNTKSGQPGGVGSRCPFIKQNAKYSHKRSRAEPNFRSPKSTSSAYITL